MKICFFCQIHCFCFQLPRSNYVEKILVRKDVCFCFRINSLRNFKRALYCGVWSHVHVTLFQLKWTMNFRLCCMRISIMSPNCKRSMSLRFLCMSFVMLWNLKRSVIIFLCEKIYIRVEINLCVCV